LIAFGGWAAAQTSSPKPSTAQNRVQAKLLQQKKIECAKLGKYAVATTVRGTTVYKCAAKPGG
jgi:hypothetical protein